MAPAMPRPAVQMKMKVISIRHREVRLILASGPGRATDLPMADQDSRRPMAPDLKDRPEDPHPKWMELPAPVQEVHPVVRKKDSVLAVHPSSRCSEEKRCASPRGLCRRRIVIE